MRELKDKICEKCNKPKIMYYREYCPRCTVPEIKIQYTLNLMECLYHIEATSHPGFKDKFWKHLVEDYNVSNDTTLEILNTDGQGDPIIQELFEKMGITNEDSMLFEISW